jgi:hypothetical protein
MPSEVILNVPWHEQQLNHYCGPAVAQMFLDHFTTGVVPSQNELWTDVTNNSGGARPPDAPVTGHEFPQQVCHNCQPANLPPRWECWDTTPEALRAVVTARTNAVGVALHYEPTKPAGTQRLIESLDRSPRVPAFACIDAINHWVLVQGYRRDFPDPGGTASQVGAFLLNGLYIHDPQDYDGNIRYVTAAGWLPLFGAIGCGPRTDTYAVIVGASPGFRPWVYTVAAVIIMLVLYYLLRWIGS